MLTRSQTRNQIAPSSNKSNVAPVRMTTRSQSRVEEKEEEEVITLHVTRSANRNARIIPDNTETLRRSSRIQKYNVNIDFDEASLAWRSNKQSVENGQYEYRNV
jgi:hypothetical protein